MIHKGGYFQNKISINFDMIFIISFLVPVNAERSSSVVVKCQSFFINI